VIGFKTLSYGKIFCSFVNSLPMVKYLAHLFSFFVFGNEWVITSIKSIFIIIYYSTFPSFFFSLFERHIMHVHTSLLAIVNGVVWDKSSYCLIIGGILFVLEVWDI
jgi:hypothetical protein